MTELANPPVRRSRGRIVGIVITALLAVLLAFDCVTKIVGVEASREGTAALGFPVEQTPVIGLVLLACLVVFLIPRTAVLGAIGITAYLGGAVTANMRAEKPVATFVLSAVYVGVLLWIGLILRRPELLRTLGLRRRID
jgi:DoxX-like family